MSTWKLSVCGPCGSSHRFPNLNGSIAALPNSVCAFDRFYDRIVNINQVSTRLSLPQDQDLMNLLVVDIVGSVEAYFREILSAIVELCPVAKKDSADLSVSMASALWGFRALRSRLGFEQNSLAGSKSLQQTLTKMRLMKPVDGGDISLLLSEYDKICELRHVIAHSRGLVSGKNAVIMGLERQKNAMAVKITQQDIQDIAALALSLCRAFHQEIFHTICKRWAVDWRKDISGWDKQKASRLFRQVWKVFYSVNDSLNIPGPNVKTERQVRALIESEFNVVY